MFFLGKRGSSSTFSDFVSNGRLSPNGTSLKFITPKVKDGETMVILPEKEIDKSRKI